jgi:hypothetical protein
MRIRGIAYIELDPAAVDERANIAMGIGVASDDAFTATALPDLSSEPEFPWIWHNWFYVSSGSLAALSTSTENLIHKVVVDSKSMRKINAGQSIFVSVQVGDVQDQTGTFDFGYGLRLLVGS